MYSYMYLEHHGVKGQKWGVRRFQNPDGTLIHPKRKKSGNIKQEPAKAKEEKVNPRKPSKMSDEQLKSATARLQAEKQYMDLYAAVNGKTVNRGKKITSDILSSIGKGLLGTVSDVTKSSSKYFLTRYLTKKFGKEVAKGIMGDKSKDKKKKSGSDDDDDDD